MVRRKVSSRIMRVSGGNGGWNMIPVRKQAKLVEHARSKQRGGFSRKVAAGVLRDTRSVDSKAAKMVRQVSK